MNLLQPRPAIYLCHGGINLCRVVGITADPDSGRPGLARRDFGVRSRVSPFETNRAHDLRRQSYSGRTRPAEQSRFDDLRHPDHRGVDLNISDS